LSILGYNHYIANVTVLHKVNLNIFFMVVYQARNEETLTILLPRHSVI